MAEHTKETKAWTDAEKTHFLMQAIAQMQAAGGTLNFKQFTLPGRTPKALTHLWAKIRKENAAYANQLAAERADGSKVVTPPSKSGPTTPTTGKRTAQAAFKEGNDGNESPSPTGKRQRASNGKPRAKAKSSLTNMSVPAPVDDDEGEQMNDDNGGVKHELELDARFLMNPNEI
ncbi:hypothetical protein F5Y03DRAFT_396194 [Xylaria venustula]|nr:hypothetical protein F5Y03DRAFT_396194 [Xylaria venustula]